MQIKEADRRKDSRRIAEGGKERSKEGRHEGRKEKNIICQRRELAGIRPADGK